jgi:hypothetical protein
MYQTNNKSHTEPRESIEKAKSVNTDTTAFNSQASDREPEPCVSSDPEDSSDNDLEDERQVYDQYMNKMANALITAGLQPRIWLRPAIFHRRQADNWDAFVEIIPIARFRSLIKKTEGAPEMTKEVGTSFRRVHKGPMMQLSTLEEDLARFNCLNIPPEDKKHMKFSILSPESIMILKRLIDYCNQKHFEIENFL